MAAHSMAYSHHKVGSGTRHQDAEVLEFGDQLARGPRQSSGRPSNYRTLFGLRSRGNGTPEW